MQIITGFHAIEELLRSVEAQLEKKNSETKSSVTKNSDAGKKIGGDRKAVVNGKAAVSGKAVGGGKASGLRLKILYAKQ